MGSGGRLAVDDTVLLSRDHGSGLVSLWFLGARNGRSLAILDAFDPGLYRRAFAQSAQEVVGAPDGATVVLIGEQQRNLLPTIGDISTHAPDALIIVLSRLRAERDVMLALHAGAAGFCDFSASPEAIARTVEDAVDNGAAVPRWLVPHLVNRLRQGSRRVVQCPAGSIELTEREWEVLQQLRLGRTTSEIAAALYVSAGTIRSHVWALVRKCGVSDREALIDLTDAA
jgi:DNA-binding NarL/FixJ family response regulator